MPSAARMPPCVDRIRNSRPPSADGFQPMPAFCVQPNRSPDGRSRSISGVSGSEPDGPWRVRMDVVQRRIGGVEGVRHGFKVQGSEVQGSRFRFEVRDILRYRYEAALGVGAAGGICQRLRQPPHRVVDVGGVGAREADAQLGIAGRIGIEGVARHERDAGGQRAIEQRAGADVRGDAAPEIQPAAGPRELQRTGREVALDRRDASSRSASRARRAASRGARRSCRRGSARHRELHQVLRVRVEPLLDDRHLIDDRRRGRQPAEPQPRRQHLREAVQVNDDVRRVEVAQRRAAAARGSTARDRSRPRRSARDSARPAGAARAASGPASSSRSGSGTSGSCRSTSADSGRADPRARRCRP